MLRQKEHTALKIGAKARLVCNAQHNNVGMWRFDQHLERRGKLWAAPSSWIAVPRGYGLRLRTSIKGEDKPKPKASPSWLTNHVPSTIISNTPAVRSGRLLTAPSIRWSRLYMTAHSYAVSFHCILINTWLNQERTTLLISQDKRTRHYSPNICPHLRNIRKCQ